MSVYDAGMADGSAATAPHTCPLPRRAVIDRYFLEHRAKLIDLAAFLDRVDRSIERDAKQDHRVEALREAIPLLLEEQPGRTKRILEKLSDPSTKPLDHAPGKGATGAPPSPTTSQPPTPTR